MYYVWKANKLLVVCRTFEQAVKYARSAGGYVEQHGQVVWGMRF